ncbi:MAG: marine proteobacterial sortase target protein [Gammaproteobacteria bacterium]|nr:marine proteobacterial sortase target protein [Gammaproteobacteria bacterium]
MHEKARNTAPAWIMLLLTILAVRPGFASTKTLSPADMQTGSLLMRMSGGYVTAALLNTDVNIKVNGLVARVSVMQEFKNEGVEWVEGIYVFPLPDDAAVDRMRLYIGDRLIEGEIREKQQARKEYEQAKQAGKRTSLVEQRRANLFTTSIANVAPGETVIVEIEYLENIRYDDGTFSLRFPMTLTPRYIPGQALTDRQGSGWSADTSLVADASLITPPMVNASRGHKVSLQVSVNAGMPLEIIASRYHPVNVSENSGQYRVALASGRVPMDHDFELLWRPVSSSAPRAMAFAETINGEPHYLLMVMPPDGDASTAASMPREMIFVIDTSGSMHGVSMQQAKQALQRALDGLHPGDRFNVIEFNSHANALFEDSVAVEPGSVGMAQNFVGRLRANGGTEMQSALRRALRTPPTEAFLRQVIFITDGAVGNEEGLFELITKQLDGARMFTVGIGSAPNSWFMRKAAESGRGTFTTISALHEVAEKMDRLFRKLEHPQVTNINLLWPGGTLVDSYPSVVPDLYLGEPISVKAKASGAFRPGATIRIEGDSVAGAWGHDVALDVDAQSPGVAALWARARIAELLDAERRGADSEVTRQAVVATALAHHLVSKHTSLVAVDKTPVRPAGDPLASEQVPNLMPYGQSGSAIFGFPATATNAPGLRLGGALTLLAALLMLAMPALRRRVTHGLAY